MSGTERRTRQGAETDSRGPRARPTSPAIASGGTPLGNRALGRVLSTPQRRRGPSSGELGRQPDPYVRALLQSAVGRDLGDVRVRSGTAQRAVLDRLGVDALTRGREVAVRSEHDTPGSPGGRALLLHELVHVLQQDDADRSGRPPAATDLEQQEQAARELSLELVTRAPFPHQQAPAPW